MNYFKLEVIYKLFKNPHKVFKNLFNLNRIDPLEVRIFQDILQSIKLIPLIHELEPLNVSTSSNFRNVNSISKSLNKDLELLLTKYGSDKAQNGYAEIYEFLLSKFIQSSAVIVELGIGTNNILKPSNMGPDYSPGASLFAFKEYLYNSNLKHNIFGLDVDQDIFFEDDTITCLYVDQLDKESLAAHNQIFLDLGGIDLFIDDGLHRPTACLNTLLNYLKLLKIYGFYIIEDQDPILREYWSIVLSGLSKKFKFEILSTRADVDIYIIRRVN